MTGCAREFPTPTRSRLWRTSPRTTMPSKTMPPPCASSPRCGAIIAMATPRGQVTEFERRLLLTSDSRNGAAIVLLLELRCRWRLTDKLPLSSRAPKRSIVPELRREAFDAAVKLLMVTGCIQLVRGATRSLQIRRCAIRTPSCSSRRRAAGGDGGNRPSEARKPQTATKKNSVSDAQEKETPPTGSPAAPDVNQYAEVAAMPKEKADAPGRGGDRRRDAAN